LIPERLGVAAGCQEPRPKMILADDAEVLRCDQPCVPAHRGQQLGDSGAVDLLHAKERRQRNMRATDILEHFALYGGPREPAEFGDELPNATLSLEVAVARYMGGEVSLQPRIVVPMRAGRITGAPLVPLRIGGGDVDEPLAAPCTAQSQVRVEPHV